MLSFETHRGYLKNGKLTADDGTSLAVNGTSWSASVKPSSCVGRVSFTGLLIVFRSCVPSV